MLFDKFLFPLPSSIFLGSICSISLLYPVIGGISESKGNNLPYSKFGNTNCGQKSKIESILLSSRIGMLIVYTPALLASAISFWVYPNQISDSCWSVLLLLFISSRGISRCRLSINIVE
ncbi:hypothetical protein MKX01_034633 [Papaver californicum]|nr:hypothetical protein MKX01_034633 [Papaver californicum]